VEIFNIIGSASRVLNIVSTGDKPGELYLTFTFEWDHPEIKKGSKEELDKQKQYQASAPPGVAKTLDKIRDMVRMGGVSDLESQCPTMASDGLQTRTGKGDRFSWFRLIPR
jgi:hypothetical protein